MLKYNKMSLHFHNFLWIPNLQFTFSCNLLYMIQPLISIFRVTQVANLGEGRQIIRVKNCSGPKPINWVGAWHPDDTRWSNVSDAIRKELDAETFHDGGE